MPLLNAWQSLPRAARAVHNRLESRLLEVGTVVVDGATHPLASVCSKSSTLLSNGCDLFTPTVNGIDFFILVANGCNLLILDLLSEFFQIYGWLNKNFD